ncbi:MAG TPA: glycine oxidase ThiO [Candidatus Krumholzibacteria bacterium]|nr:glycine oxidase ThiO [Candidatus Krumholzibacteria bacterium]
MTGRVAVVGGGIIGMAVAWRMARAGASVTLFERDRAGAGTSRVAAGMLAPITEAGHGTGDEAMVRFAKSSLARYPGFVAELEQDADVPVRLDTRGTLLAALDRDDRESLQRAFEHRRASGLSVEWISGERAREIEPLLSPRVVAAVWIPDDHQVDTRSLLAALVRACARRGVEMRENARVDAVRIRSNVVLGVRADGADIDAEVVIVCAGAWTPQIEGVDLAAPVRPVKGQIVRLRGEGFPLSHVVRTPRVYVLNKADGSVLVGATQEEMGYDVAATAGAVKDLLEHAWEAIPAIYELPFEGVEVGLRPASRDHLPIIGETKVRGLVMATGHFRSGILLAPATADAVLAGVANGFGAEMEPFSPRRFEGS